MLAYEGDIMPIWVSSSTGLANAIQSATPDNVVRYIDEMTGVLLALAVQVRLEPTEHYLAMAKNETEGLVRDVVREIAT
jgi:hypothetical protein